MEAEKNEMQKLEERARQLAEESIADQAKPEKGILFVRWVFFVVSFCLFLSILKLKNNLAF